MDLLQNEFDAVMFSIILYKMKCQNDFTTQYIFISACEEGNIDVIKYLFYKNILLLDKDIINTDIDIHYNNDYPFISACKSGNVKVVKFLCELYLASNGRYKPINIETNFGYGFQLACENGWFDIIKYLCELYKQTPDMVYKPYNINFCHAEGFRRAIAKRHDDIAIYLFNLHKIDNNYEPIYFLN